MARSRTRSGDLHRIFRGSSASFLNLIAHLSILFEDLRIEVAGVEAADATLGTMDTIGREYRQMYFFRRSLVTLSEVARCLNAITANENFREHRANVGSGHLQDVDDANSYFSKKIGLIKRFRNEFGGHLDPTAAARATEFLSPGTSGTVSFVEPTNHNFVLQNQFVATVLKAAVISKLDPGIDFAQEFQAVLYVIAESIRHTQRATQALVYGFLWDRFGQP